MLALAEGHFASEAGDSPTMDELHARVGALRSPLTELNVSRQPDPELDDSDQSLRQGEANVVEMSSRQVHEAFVPNLSEPLSTPRATAKRTQCAAAKRPSAATHQPAFSFRQMRDGHQQPYIDELKRLEAQAERINQLLADRKRKQASAEASVGLAAGQATDAPLVEMAKASTQKKASKRAKQPSKQPSRSPQREVLPMSAPDDDTEVLAAQAERIKQLLQTLEAAIVEGEALPCIGRKRKSIERSIAEDRTQTADSASVSPLSPLDPASFTADPDRYSADGQSVAVSQTQATTGATDPKAQQEATETAQALRYLASRGQAEPAIAPPQPELGRHPGRSRNQRSGLPASLPTIRRYGVRLRQCLQMPQMPLDRLGDAVLWIVLAAAMRVGAQFLLAPFPALAPLGVVLMVAPAAAAVYLAIYVPNAGVSIYRLFLIMLGLLLGGRF